MDRESADDQSPIRRRLNRRSQIVPEGPVIVSVCTTCKTADGGTVVGPDMFAAVRAALGEG